MLGEHKMKKIIFLTILFLLLFFSIVTSQDQKWTMHMFSDDIQTLAIEDQILWVVTEKGLVKFNTEDDSEIIYNSSNSLITENSINCIKIDCDGNKWLGTSTGLIKFDGAEWLDYSSHFEYLKQGVDNITIDELNFMWILQINNGIIKFDGSSWENIAYSGPIFNNVTSFLIDKTGNPWIGTEPGLGSGGGVIKYDISSHSWKFFNKTNSNLPSNSISGLACDNFNNLWIGTNYGLVKLYCFGDDYAWKIYNTTNCDIADDCIYSITCDDKDNLWLGTSGDHCTLLKFDGINWEEVWQCNMDYLMTDCNGNKWLIHGRYIFQYNEGGIPTSTENLIDNHYPQTFTLMQNYPNPFNPSTVISYHLPANSIVTLSIFNALGKEIDILVNKEQSAGYYNVIFNAENLSSGIYYYRLNAKDFVETKKMILLK